MNRRGVALLVVLWMIAALATVAAVALAGVRIGAQASINRKLLARAAWAAEACVAIYRSDAADSLREGRGIPLGRFPKAELGPETSCCLEVEDPHSRLNANGASTEALVAVLGDSALAQLVLRGRPWPAVEAMAMLPTLSEGRRALVLASLTIRGDARINLNEADARVLRAVPGFSEEAVIRIVQHRVTGVPFRSPDEALASLAPGERLAVLARYSDFAHVAITRPTVLVGHATGVAGKRALEATLTVTLVPAGNRVAIVRVESQ